MTLAEVVEEHILRTLEACGGNVSQAARELGVARETVRRRLRRMVARARLDAAQRP